MDCITVEVLRRPDESWGMQVTGEKPSYIEAVKDNSPAHDAGLCSGDYIIAVNGVSVYDANHKEVIALIAECRKIVRLKIYPADSPIDDISKFATSETNVKKKEKKQKFWTEDDTVGQVKLKKVHKEKKPIVSSNQSTIAPSQMSKKINGHKETKPKESRIKSSSSKTLSTSKLKHMDYATYCQKEEDRQNKKKSNHHNKNFDMVIDYLGEAGNIAHGNKDVTVEQKNFIVTRESQKDFDENYQLEGNFAGRKASVAGAFTGDHNVIVDGEGENVEIRGVKSRVLAGIQHFSFTEKDEPSAEDKGKILLYTTTLGIHRKIASNCEQARKILRGYRVKFEDRDIYCRPDYKEELYQRLHLEPGDEFPDMPRFYIDGVYMGGLDELQEMSDCGDLRIRLQEFPKYNLRAHCPSCEGTGIVQCEFCKGKAYKKKNRFTNLKCGSCNQKGEVTCRDCV